MDPRDWLKPESILRGLLRLVILTIVALLGKVSNDFDLLLHALAQAIPQKLLITISILILLALIAVATFLGYLLILARHKNKQLAQTPQFYAVFGAKWKYWPHSKIFEQHPFCGCCEPPKACLRRNPTDDTKVDILICPHRGNIRDCEFHLRDTQDNWLTIADALVRLERMNVPHGT